MQSSPPGGASTPTPIPLPRHWGIGEILSAKENRSVVKTLIMFSAIMVALPIGTFFVLHDYILKGEPWSGMAAVLAANIVMAGYAIIAIKEDGDSDNSGGTHQPKTMPLKVD